MAAAGMARLSLRARVRVTGINLQVSRGRTWCCPNATRQAVCEMVAHQSRGIGGLALVAGASCGLQGQGHRGRAGQHGQRCHGASVHLQEVGLQGLEIANAQLPANRACSIYLRQSIVVQPCCCLHCYAQCRASIAPVNNARKLASATFQNWQKLQHIQAYAIGCLLQRTWNLDWKGCNE